MTVAGIIVLINAFGFGLMGFIAAMNALARIERLERKIKDLDP